MSWSRVRAVTGALLLLVAISGLLDARGWSDLRRFGPHANGARPFVQEDRSADGELLDALWSQGAAAASVQACQRAETPAPMPLAIATADLDRPSAPGRSPRGAAPTPCQTSLGPTGAGHPLLLGGDAPEPAPIA